MSGMNSRREGFALAGAVLAMVLVGAIVTGGFYAAHQESQITRSAETADMAQYIAEVGLDATVGRTSFVTLDAMPVNSTLNTYTDVDVSFGGRVVGRYSTTVTRITQALFVVRSTGTVTTGGMNSGAVRTVSSVIKLRNANFDTNAAMQVYGDLEVAGSSDVDGDDVSHNQWNGCTANANSDAVNAQPGASITTRGNGNIDGDINRQQMDSTNFTVFGDITLQELIRMADKRYANNEAADPAPVSSNGVCTTSIKNNWGEPTNNADPCFAYFPIIYAEANLTIEGNGRGQGILIVQGNLEVRGTFSFFGPVIVYGTIEMEGTADIYGTVLAYGGGVLNADNNLGTGTSMVAYSSCSIARAAQGVEGLNRGLPIRNRAFMDLTSVQNSY